MLVSGIKREDLSVAMVDGLSFADLEDSGENADCIIVPGSAKTVEYRVPVAVDAWKRGRAGKVMLCGGIVREFSGARNSEAEQRRKAALELGVAGDAIILESGSRNTVEKFCLRWQNCSGHFR